MEKGQTVAGGGFLKYINSKSILAAIIILTALIYLPALKGMARPDSPLAAML